MIVLKQQEEVSDNSHGTKMDAMPGTCYKRNKKAGELFLTTDTSVENTETFTSQCVSEPLYLATVGGGLHPSRGPANSEIRPTLQEREKGFNKLRRRRNRRPVLV
ncbi:uncharacterized protein LOC108837672 [Raphanus sativus]|uniref:Uncharacterized protein LOC108837672 n=1 Tax=Raphanus sativus TaxID=3726 RepID=A0A9W3C626_RAPSA|nr:uncharacterized protein LOC108837672 [Raphanus sativus]